ncbi:uncharacterized protein LOC143192392 isoform X2 [Rhynchophorus ferrugineus]|uniref:uncharacterized protein LOC143192392 isoform X2 n=1 Tax=Rhynchophorus ferrugineus TaxID=354439 RepID=UPI003FCE8304
MSCARCGSGIYKTEEFISLNKVWHKQCFSCYQCSKRLDKDNVKIFQGELFCQCCYDSVIKKLFEVISKSSLYRPCKVVSSPSCTFNKTVPETTTKKRYCFQRCSRPAQSCSCIPNKPTVKNEYCFLFPLPREVANYYNRAHMKSQNFSEPNRCCSSSPSPQQCSSCCKKPCSCSIQLRTLPNQCCCELPPPPCKCCCNSRPSPPKCPAMKCHCQQQDSYQPIKKCHPCRRCPCMPQRSVTTPPRQSPCPHCCCEKEEQQHYSSHNKTEQCCPPKSDCRCQKSEPCYCQRKPECCPQKVVCPPKPKYCVCGSSRPCNCKMSQVKAQCTSYCQRCRQKVYAAEKISVSSGAFHSSCFTCYCCNKCLDVKNVYEGCGEIYCKQCYNHFFGIKYYGFGRVNS